MDSSDDTKFPTTTDAMQFVFQVQRTLLHTNDEDNSYNQFTSALKLFALGGISSDGLVKMLKTLFEGHEDLNSGLKNFLPMNPETKRARVSCLESELATSKEFLSNVKDRFKNEIGVYDEVLDVLIEYGNGGLKIGKVYDKIFSLCLGHADLLCEFENFIDDNEIEAVRMNTIEDYLFEIDVLLGNFRSAIERMEKVVVHGCAYTEKNELTATHLKYIGKLYGLDDQEMKKHLLKELKDDPRRVFVVLLPCLMQKEKQLREVRSMVIKFLKECHDIRRRMRHRVESVSTL